MNYLNGYHPTEAKSEIKPPKCGSAESDRDVSMYKDFLEEENNRLKKKLRKSRKEKKKWKKKYLELRDRKKSIELARIEDGLGIHPIRSNKYV